MIYCLTGFEQGRIEGAWFNTVSAAQTIAVKLIYFNRRMVVVFNINIKRSPFTGSCTPYLHIDERNKQGSLQIRLPFTQYFFMRQLVVVQRQIQRKFSQLDGCVRQVPAVRARKT